MAGYGLYRVYLHDLDAKGEVVKTKHIDSIWLPITPRDAEEMQKIAKRWKGDDLGSPAENEYDFEAKNRRPKFSRQIVANLRGSQPNLKEFTDDQIYNAYDDWYFSVGQTDESKVVEYISHE